MTLLRRLLTVAIAAAACHLAVRYDTPVDLALPYLAAVVTILSALSYPSLMLGIPLLVLAENAIPSEGLRLLAFGAIAAGVFAISQWTARGPVIQQASRSPEDVRTEGMSAIPVALSAILLLRWIPFSDVRLGRELFLLLLAALIVLVLDRTPFAVVVAVVIVLLTPAFPLRTLLLPVAILLVAMVAKLAGMPRLVLRGPSAIALGLVMLFFPWSGLVARAFPSLLQRATPQGARYVVNQALPASGSLTLDVPAGFTSLIVSGANVAHLPRGASLGRIEPGSREVRIGDAADWGFLRREVFYGTRNPMPRHPAGRIRDHGYSAWLDGAGRIPLPDGARSIRVIADANLPEGASLQVEGFE